MKDHREPGCLHVLNGKIDYSSGNSLEYQKEEGLAGHIVTYHHKGKKLVLNNLLPDSNNWNIMAVVPIKGGIKNYFRLLPNNGISSILGSVYIDVDSLREEAYMIITLHEIGHTHVRGMATDHITKQDDFILFSERNAWSYALKTMRRHDLLGWLPRKELRRFYYDKALKTYQSKLVDAVVKRHSKRWGHIDDLISSAPGVRS